jgi:flagellar protein FliL
VSAKPEATEGGEAPKSPAKSKKLLVIVGALVVVLAIAGGAAFYFISKQRAAAAEEADVEESSGKSHATAHAGPKVPPAYLPLENMVVNLADPGGEKVAQVGVTLELADAKSVDTVKAFLPTIRSSILMLISQRTSEELLKHEGKQKLAKDILRETLVPFGGAADDDEHDAEAEAPKSKKKKKKAAPASEHAAMPVVGVLFSSFIVQ